MILELVMRGSGENVRLQKCTITLLTDLCSQSLLKKQKQKNLNKRWNFD